MATPAKAASQGSHSSEKVARGNKPHPTVLDLFLSGNQVDGGARASAFYDGKHDWWVPDPEAALKEKEQDEEGKITMTPQQKARLKEDARREVLVQEYWKHHTSFPRNWTHLDTALDNCQKFEANFRLYAFGHDVRGHARNLHFKMAYVVTALTKVGVRDSPTTCKDAIQPEGALAPGSCVMVDATIEMDGVKFIKLFGGGWVFESLDGEQVMAPMDETEVGLWWYQLVCTEYLETRKAPTYAHEARTGHVLYPQEVVVVCCRCTVNGHQYLRLADGRGWVFMHRPAHDHRDSSADAATDGVEPSSQLFQECLGELAALFDKGNNAESDEGKGAIEKGLWKYQVLDKPLLVLGATMSGMLSLPGDTIMVDMRVPASGVKTKEVSVKESASSVVNRIWLRLEGGKGWIPKTDTENRAVVRFVGMASKKERESAKVRRSIAEPREDAGSEAWKVGVV